jgi:hypothetical protein
MKWIDLKQDEKTMFEHLCNYLLHTTRIDLLLTALDFRHLTSDPDNTYKYDMIRKASKASSSIYQSLKCNLLAGKPKVVLEYHYDPVVHSFYRLAYIHYMDLTPNNVGQKSLIIDKDFEYCSQPMQKRLSEGEWLGGTQFFDLKPLQELFWRAASECVFFLGHAAHQTLFSKQSGKQSGKHSQKLQPVRPTSVIPCTHVLYKRFFYPLCSYSTSLNRRHPLKREYFEKIFGSRKMNRVALLEFGLEGCDIPPKGCNSCSNILLNLRRLELLSPDEGFAVSLNNYMVCHPKKDYIALQEHGRDSLSLLGMNLMLGLLYLESVFRDQVASSHYGLKTPDVAKFLLECYEQWFMPYFEATCSHTTHVKWSFIADKLAFSACLWVSMSDQSTLEGRSACRCIYHLLQLAISQEPQFRDYTLTIALHLCTIHLKKAQETGSNYDVFELSYFGTMVISMSSSRALQSLELYHSLQKCLNESKLSRNTTQKTDFPGSLSSYKHTSTVSHLSMEFDLWKSNANLKQPYPSRPKSSLRSRGRRGEFRCLEIYGGNQPHRSDYPLSSSLEIIRSWDMDIESLRKVTPNTDLEWQKRVKFDDNGSLIFKETP